MVLDFSKDRNNPNSLSKTRLDLARKFLANSEDNSEDSEGDERINSNSLSKTRLDLARKFLANSKDSEGDERIPLAFRNIVLFDMTLEDLESNVVNGCLLCDWLLQGHSKLTRSYSKLVLAADSMGDYLHFGTLKLIPGTPKSNSRGAYEK
jgi:hypothetical protein